MDILDFNAEEARNMYSHSSDHDLANILTEIKEAADSKTYLYWYEYIDSDVLVRLQNKGFTIEDISRKGVSAYKISWEDNK